MCNMGVTLRVMGLPVPAFEYWWKALQLSPINWDILVGIRFLHKRFIVELVKGQHPGNITRH